MSAVRVLHITDTHLSASKGVPERMCWVLDRIAAEPPDLVVHTGDIVEDDPDDEVDRAFARSVFDNMPCPIFAVPGNHDIGFYGEDEDRPRRLAAFNDTWGADRFELDVDGWHLVGANAYLLGGAEHDAWLASTVANDGPNAVFIHQPVVDAIADGWEMPIDVQQVFARAVEGADIRLVASGHRHCYADHGTHVWAPSVTIPGTSYAAWGDPRPGVVEFTFTPAGHFTHRAVHSGDG